jgi:hypothetical protein
LHVTRILLKSGHESNLKIALDGFLESEAWPMTRNGKLSWNPKRQARAEARLAGAFRQAVRELNRCYERSRADQKRIGAVLRSLGQALRRYHGKGLR